MNNWNLENKLMEFYKYVSLLNGFKKLGIEYTIELIRNTDYLRNIYSKEYINRILRKEINLDTF